MIICVKQCSKCKKEKDTKFFWKDKPYCIDCGTKDRLDRYYNKGGKEKQKARSFKALMKKYGITPEIYEQERVKQDFKCILCGKHEKTQPHKRLYVDHCHDSGLYRGLLCVTCNTALGGFNDDIELMKKAIEYVENNRNRHREQLCKD